MKTEQLNSKDENRFKSRSNDDGHLNTGRIDGDENGGVENSTTRNCNSINRKGSLKIYTHTT